MPKNIKNINKTTIAYGNFKVFESLCFCTLLCFVHAENFKNDTPYLDKAVIYSGQHRSSQALRYCTLG